MLDDNSQVTQDAPAPAAPSAPGGASAAAPDAPAGPRGTQQVIDEARQRLERGEPLTTSRETETPADQQPPADEPAAGDQPESEPPAEEQPEGEQSEGGEEQPPADEGTKLNVTLPGLEERGEKPLELEAPDQETYERLNRLNNEAALGRQVKQERREIQHSRTELAELEDKIAIDPTGFVLDQVQEADRTAIAMQLFFEPAVLDAIQGKLKESGVEGGINDILENPEALRTLRAELKAERLELRDQLRQATEQRRAMQANAEKVVAEIEKLIPESVAGEQRELLFRDAVRDVRDRVQRLGLTQIDPQDVQLLVSARFRQMGISLSADGNGGADRNKAAPGQPPAAPAGRTAEQFKQAREARRVAAAPAPAGAGAPAAKPRPNLPKTTEERIKLARKVGLRALLGHS
jgi:hypothetical protein